MYFNSGPVSFNANKSIFVTFQMKCVSFIILLFMDIELYTYFVGDIFKQIDLKKRTKNGNETKKIIKFLLQKTYIILLAVLFCPIL